MQTEINSKSLAHGVQAATRRRQVSLSALVIGLAACSDKPLIYPKTFTGQDYVPPVQTQWSTEPPADAHLEVRDVGLPWEALEGHLGWTREQSISIASAAERRISEVSFPAAELVHFLAGALALSPDASRLAVSARLHVTWETRVFVVPVGNGPTAAITRAPGVRVVYSVWAPEGNSLYIYNSEYDTGLITKSTPDGARQSSLDVPFAGYGPVAVSPDGSRFAAGGDELVLAGVDGSGRVSLEQIAGRVALAPTWSPDGRRIAFASFPNTLTATDSFEIVVLDLESREREVVLALPDPNRPEPDDASSSCSNLAWSPSGQKLAYCRCTPGSGAEWELRVLALDSLQSTTIERGSGNTCAVSWVP